MRLPQRREDDHADRGNQNANVQRHVEPRHAHGDSDRRGRADHAAGRDQERYPKVRGDSDGKTTEPPVPLQSMVDLPRMERLWTEIDVPDGVVNDARGETSD